MKCQVIFFCWLSLDLVIIIIIIIIIFPHAVAQVYQRRDYAQWQWVQLRLWAPDSKG